MGQVITFYSYKGGTGRTMALANAACLLAKSLPADEAVLAIDWDLEAPGLHRFFDQPAGAGRQPGVIDLVIELQSLLDRDESLRKDSDAVADLIASFDFDRFIVPTQVPNVRFMPAGTFDDDYENRVVSFNWPALYEKAPSALMALADFLGTRYRYVLIDSRTGLSDLTGVCAMILPEKLVTVFTPSRQSIDGLVGVVQRALKYRSQSPDLRPLGVFPLPSRIELAEPDLRASWRLGDDKGHVGYQPMFESLFRDVYEVPECSLQNYFDEVQIQHVPRYAYGEQIAVLVEKEPDRLSLTRSYQAFVSRLEHLSVPWDTIAGLAETLVPRPPDEIERSYLESLDLCTELRDIPGLARTLVALAGHQQRRGLKDEAERTIARAMPLITDLDGELKAELLLVLGDLALATDPLKAMALYNNVLSIPELPLLTQGDALRNRGYAELMLFHFEAALHYFDSAAQRFHQSSSQLAARRILDLQPHFAKASFELRRFETAANLFSTILKRAEASLDEPGMAEALVGLAMAKLGEEDLQGALENATKAEEICRRLGWPNPDLWLVHARIAAAKSDFDQADKLINQAVQEYRKASDKRGIATALRYAGDFRAARRQVKAS